MKFSIRGLMLGIFLVAAWFPITSGYTAWQTRFVAEQYPEYEILAKFRDVSTGTPLQQMEKLFPNLQPVDNTLGPVILSGKELKPSDKVYLLTVNSSFARFLHIRDGKLFDHQFNNFELENTLKSMSLAKPEWYIHFGAWLLYLTFLLCVGLTLLLWKIFRKGSVNSSSGMNAAE